MVMLLQICIKLVFTDTLDGDLFSDLNQSSMTNWHSQPKSGFTTDLNFVVLEAATIADGFSGGSVLDWASSGSDSHSRSLWLLVEICLS